jgi:hypothetical protein
MKPFIQYSLILACSLVFVPHFQARETVKVPSLARVPPELESVYGERRRNLERELDELQQRSGDVKSQADQDTLAGQVRDWAVKAREFNSELAAAKRASSRPNVASSSSDDGITQIEQEQLEEQYSVWVRNEKHLIDERLERPNPLAETVYASIKAKEESSPTKEFAALQPGDVLLISPEPGNAVGWAIHKADASPASHTVLFLKEVNGTKLFLDNTAGIEDVTSGRGPHIITDKVFLKNYGQREAHVAEPAQFGVAQPLNPSEAAKLWSAAHEVGIKELNGESPNARVRWSNFGVFGNDNMVCSEASRWALVKAGRDIPDTSSRFTKLLSEQTGVKAGVKFSPGDFFRDKQDFIISELQLPK